MSVAAAKDSTGPAGNKTTTINLRAPEKTKELIDAAAEVVGKSRTEFMLECARKHALDVLLDQRLFRLEPEKFEKFVEILDNPPPANEELKALMRKQPLWEK